MTFLNKCTRLTLITLLSIFSVFPTPAIAQTQNLDSRINDLVAVIADPVVSIIFYSVQINGSSLPIIVVWLFVAAIFFTLYFSFVNIRSFGLGISIVRGQYTTPEEKGEVSHFQALSAALSGTVGLGNIAGVAVAISIGGPGATFWMILAGLFGMSSKFIECTLGVKYRQINADGSISGGPMYYLRDGLKEKGFKKTGQFLAIFFALMCIGGSFGAGNLFQVNQAFQQVEVVTGGADSFFHERGWLFGLIMAVLVGTVIIGGIRSIAAVTARLVPLMCIIYLTAAVIILAICVDQIPAAIEAILHGAFTAGGIEGGVIGVLIQGLRRATFSNEAGIGSAPIAHSAVRTNEPITEGLVGLLEPFVDTIVVCTMTALVIIVTGVYQQNGIDGVTLTSSAFATVFSWFPVVLAIAVLLFAFSTMITWSYYGLKAWTYMFGNSKQSELIYKAIFCVVVIVGATMGLGKVVDFSDAMIFAMAIPNILGLYILAPDVKRDLHSYLSRIKSGEIKKVTK